MHQIQSFEAFLLPEGMTRYHVHRRGKASISLPVSATGASHAFKLYQPQRRLAQLKTWTLGALILRGLHPWVLKKEVTGVRANFKKWDFDYSPETVGILLGSSDHLIPRAVASFRGANGWEVAKLGEGETARRMLRQEAAVLKELSAGDRHVPRCLGLHELEDMTVLRMPYLAGETLSIGDSSEALEVLRQWIGKDAPQAIGEFEEWKSIRAALESTADGKEALESLSSLMLRPVIAHGDFARWNLLHQTNGPLIALDWEWGTPRGMPGLDLAHYFAQDARLVRQLDSREAIRTIVAELEKPQAKAYLEKTGWENHVIEPVLACAAYKQGARHQKNPEFLDACLKEYLAQTRKSGKNAGVVRQAPLVAPPSDIPTSPPPAAKPDRPERDARIRISVVTASYKQVGYLKCCAASIRDQTGDFQVEHLVHDAGSGSEFDQWAASQQGAVCVSESDDGMYDAINRGFRKSSGEIIAWLNCDEQYLPGTLERVARYFEAHPETDILFGDVILVDEMMTPLAYRRAVMPSLGHIRHSHLSTFSAATFVRRRVLDEGHYLQTRWKTIADAVWIEELLAAGYRAATLPVPLAIFCMLGSNLGQSALLFQERRKWESELGATNRWWKQWYIMEYRMERLRVGAYCLRKVAVSAYVPGYQKRLTKTRWVSGQWSVAKSEAENLRSWRDGTMGGLATRPRRRRWSLLHAACFLSIAISVDRLAQGDAVKGPFILLLSLLFLSFRSRLDDMIKIAVCYFAASWYLLSERPTDVLIVRLGTFTVGAILAIFWSASLRNLEAWIRGTVALIRRIPCPMILTDRFGKIMLVNNAGCAWLRRDEQGFLNKELHAMAAGSEEQTAAPASVRDWEDRPPSGLLQLTLAGASQETLANANVFVVGMGRFRFYAFMLRQADET